VNIYVGNLPYEVTEDEVEAAFAAYGRVDSVSIVKDRYTGKSRGFGFVEMPSDDEAEAAIADLNGRDMKGRRLTVSRAHSRGERRERGTPPPVGRE